MYILKRKPVHYNIINNKIKSSTNEQLKFIEDLMFLLRRQMLFFFLICQVFRSNNVEERYYMNCQQLFECHCFCRYYSNNIN